MQQYADIYSLSRPSTCFGCHAFSTPDDGCMTPETCRGTWQRINVYILLHRVGPLSTFQLDLPHHNPLCTSDVSHTCHLAWPSHSSWFGHPNIRWGVQIIKLLFMYSSSLPCYLVPPWPKYFPRYPALKHTQPMFQRQCERPSFTPRRNYGSVHLGLYIFAYIYINIYRVSQEECARLREDVPYVKVYRYNPKHLCPKLNGYGDNGQRSLKLWQLLHTCWLPNTY